MLNGSEEGMQNWGCVQIKRLELSQDVMDSKDFTKCLSCWRKSEDLKDLAKCLSGWRKSEDSKDFTKCLSGWKKLKH